ncbi:hypothetical protein B0T20DRAFT_249391 [Sordaria brevicollis]|uniref:Uncharacterized protein n=1 Tax=Sordaria brevicollis TaxID=83679 RepID=A0AAE0UAQ0_SORBR|nr:hypothetical protein B0T20DRAFT_249391 [Sordaria brevicollis]
MQVRLGRARCLSLNSGSLELLLSVSRWDGWLRHQASSSPISGKLWSQTPLSSRESQTPSRLLSLLSLLFNHRSIFADDDGKSPDLETDYLSRHIVLQLQQHSISLTGSTGSQPFGVSPSQHNQV